MHDNTWWKRLRKSYIRKKLSFRNNNVTNLQGSRNTFCYMAQRLQHKIIGVYQTKTTTATYFTLYGSNARDN